MLTGIYTIFLLLIACAHGQEGVSAPADASLRPIAPINVEIADSVPAEYPASAIANRVEGTVSVSAVIAPSGAVVFAQADDANPLLQIAAVEATRKYTFKAHKGDAYVAVKCWAELIFSFKLPKQTGAAPGPLLIPGNLIHADTFPDSMRVSESVMRTRVVRTIEPVYPRAAMKAKAQGTVVLDLSIGQDGKVRDVQVLSGTAVLSEPMVKAVREWEFQPTNFLGKALMLKLGSAGP